MSDDDCALRHAAADAGHDVVLWDLMAAAAGATRQQDAYDDESSFVSCIELSSVRTGRSASPHCLAPDLEGLASFSLLDDQANVDSSHGASTKRKRLSDYMTPACSYASLAANHPVALFHPLCAQDTSNQQLDLHAHSFEAVKSACPRSQLSLQSLPEETLVIISSFLATPQVRSFSLTNRAVRAILMTSQAALENIWMNVLREAFPNVFFRTVVKQASHKKHIMITSSDVQFVDSFQMPLTGLTTASTDTGSATKSINLSLLTGLFPKTYPRCIDAMTLQMDSHLHPFESYHMNIPSHNKLENYQEAEKESSSVVVPVVQFVGRVGVGDRCIRSDRSFPTVCKCLVDEDDVDSGSKRFRRLSSIFKTRRLVPAATSSRTRHHNGARSRKWDRVFRKWANTYNNRNALINASSVDSLPNHMSNIRRTLEQQPPLTPLGLLTFTPPAQAIMPPHLSPPPPPRQNLLVTPHPHSPLFRFLSSLSHRCDSVSSTSSMNDHSAVDLDDSHRSSDSSTTSIHLDRDAEFGQEEDDDEIGVNNYGVRVKLGLTKCKQQIGKLTRHCCKPKEMKNLRPFVTPIVISQRSQGHNILSKDINSSSGFDARPQSKLLVDVTPRLCAYFEVTILKQSKRNGAYEPSINSQQRNDTLRQADHLAPRVQPRVQGLLHDDIQWNNNPWRWRIPPPVLLPMHPLVGMAIHEGPWFSHVYGDDFRQRPPVERVVVENNGVHRHECVAVGLSTLAFRPRDKMPGWDDHSYGYHGDDGGIFHGQGEMIKRYGPPFGPGDTVGCGLEYSSKKIFFVKNGEFLGFAFDVLRDDVIERGLYPTVGVDTECPLFVNFGAHPFCFDLATFAKEGCGVMEE